MPSTERTRDDGNLALDSTAELSLSPVIILTTSRSGSTLLRFILDSHPDFACPPETGLGEACAGMVNICTRLEDAARGSSAMPTAGAAASQAILSEVRTALDRVYARYLSHHGKRRWCDKSLDSYRFADLLAQIYPDARFLCMYRHCMDVIASGVEICPWGVSRFGFDPYVAQYPGNNVAAIGAYWLDTTQAMMAFEDKNPQFCHRVRYEDLVTAPEEALTRILSFLDAAQAPDLTRRCFDMAHEGNGAGDEKIWFTAGITSASLGRGAQVPVRAIPLPLRDGINQMLSKLRYRPVDDEWNASIEPVDPRIDSPAADNHNDRTASELETIVRAIRCRLTSNPADKLRDIICTWPALSGKSVELVVHSGNGSHRNLIWTFNSGNGAARASQENAGGARTATIIGGLEAWRSLLDSETNLIAEMSAGKIRCVNTRDAYRIRSDEIHAIASLLGFTHIPVTRASM